MGEVNFVGAMMSIEEGSNLFPLTYNIILDQVICV